MQITLDPRDLDNPDLDTIAALVIYGYINANPGPLNQTALARDLRLERETVNRHLRRLVERGHLTETRVGVLRAYTATRPI